MTNTFTVSGHRAYHLNAECPALDSARLDSDGTVHVAPFEQATAMGRPGCVVCALPMLTEWTLTTDNLGGLWELIEPSKPHYGVGADGRTQVDGLTIWAHAGLPRTVARFGDTITRHVDGRYTVTAPTAQEG